MSINLTKIDNFDKNKSDLTHKKEVDMLCTGYIDEIKRQFIAVYNFPENPEMPGVPLAVPDGEYPMETK